MALQLPPLKPRTARTKTLLAKIAIWEALSTKVKANLTDLPQATDDQTAMDQVISQLKAFQGQEENISEQLRKANGDRRLAVAQGVKLRNRLIAHVQGKYGVEDEKVLDFGIRPRNRRFRRKPRTTVQPPAAQLASPTTAPAPASAAASDPKQ
ncbi:MAG TPA: hypothetical protein VOA87_03630 [Thermoanaerobaculia bacterium]|nr:hypothetical protein [Thermoanaerobaculia bacterium]